MKPTGNFFSPLLYKYCLAIWVPLSIALIPACSFAQPDIMGHTITLPRQNNTLYGIFSEITRQTGYFFIYDSDLIDNNRRVRIPETEEPLGQFLKKVLGDSDLSFRSIENHILIYLKDQTTRYSSDAQDYVPPVEDYHLIQGRVVDHATGAPLAFASVGLPHRGLGVPANTDGFFRFRIPAAYFDDSLRISFMGYKTRYLPIGLMAGNKVEVRLITDYISIQEVIIRYFDPLEVLGRAIKNRSLNYNTQPVNLLTFYREGVKKGNRLLNYSEAIFSIYKSGIYDHYNRDQAKLLKSRNIRNLDHTDTLALKLKGGVQSSLDLDIVKNLPDFLDSRYFSYYQYQGAGLVSLEGRTVYAIDFSQADFVREPLFMGVIYVDTENYAILKSEFEVNPEFLHLATDRFVVRRERGLRARFENIKYTVSYSQYDQNLYISHVRADIRLRVRQRNQLVGSNFWVFFEMAVSQVKTENVIRPGPRETLQANTIFADHAFHYDHGFWGNYNIITPETHINQELMRINAKIESLVRGIEP